MKRFAATIFILSFSIIIVGCNGDSNKKAAYELQERCGRTAEKWVKAKYGEIKNYRAHYNTHLNKCFVLATLSQSGFPYSIDCIYDVNENKEYGNYIILYKSEDSARRQCKIRDKYYGGSSGAQAEQKWNEFVKEIMEE